MKLWNTLCEPSGSKKKKKISKEQRDDEIFFNSRAAQVGFVINQ
jgi:hypothetical protein